MTRLRTLLILLVTSCCLATGCSNDGDINNQTTLTGQQGDSGT